MPHVLCAGLIAADLLFDVADYPLKGEKHRASGSRMIGGGGARNAAEAIARLGGTVSLAGTIGADGLGAFLLDGLAAHGVKTDLLRVQPDLRTASSAILITPDGERTIINHREDALFAGGVTLPDPFPFDAVLTDTRWPQGASDIMQAARQAGKPAVLDGEAPVLHATDALHAASHVIFSEQGLSEYMGDCDAAALSKAFDALGVWVAVTRGARTVVYHDGHGTTEVPSFAVQTRDTLGAGDVWHGAFTLALANGKTERDAIVWANAAAALKVSRMPDQPPLPDASEVQAFLTAQAHT